MDKRLAVFIVHGIGAQKRGFSQPMEENIKRNFKKSLKYMGEHERKGQEDALNFQEGLWADITQDGEDRLKERLFNDTATSVDWIKSRRFFVDNLGDAISYFKGRQDDPYSQYKEIHERIGSLIDDLCEKTAQEKDTLLTVVSHSLGTVVLSDFFYDQKETLTPEKKLIFSNFFTLGSPIALYANRFFGHDHPQNPFAEFKPQKVADNLGVWVNVFDEDDIIGYPIRPINKHCQNVVTADLNVSVGSFLSGWSPASHVGYWEDEAVGKIIAEKLAIDWLRANRWDKKKKTQKRIQEYKKRYNMPLN